MSTPTPSTIWRANSICPKCTGSSSTCPRYRSEERRVGKEYRALMERQVGIREEERILQDAGWEVERVLDRQIDRVHRLFFFSSRRRHTRYIGDWSSDVCSSDLNWLTEPS